MAANQNAPETLFYLGMAWGVIVGLIMMFAMILLLALAAPPPHLLSDWPSSIPIPGVPHDKP